MTGQESASCFAECAQELQSEADAKLKEAERLRAAEKFMTVTAIADISSL